MNSASTRRAASAMRQYAVVLLVAAFGLAMFNALLPIGVMTTGRMSSDTAVFLAFWVGAIGVKSLLALLVAVLIWALAKRVGDPGHPRVGIRLGVVVAALFPFGTAVVSLFTGALVDVLVWLFVCGLALGLVVRSWPAWRPTPDEA